jgi:hypothetical protein
MVWEVVYYIQFTGFSLILGFRKNGNESLGFTMADDFLTIVAINFSRDTRGKVRSTQARLSTGWWMRGCPCSADRDKTIVLKQDTEPTISNDRRRLHVITTIPNVQFRKYE